MSHLRTTRETLQINEVRLRQHSPKQTCLATEHTAIASNLSPQEDNTVSKEPPENCYKSPTCQKQRILATRDHGKHTAGVETTNTTDTQGFTTHQYNNTHECIWGFIRRLEQRTQVWHPLTKPNYTTPHKTQLTTPKGTKCRSNTNDKKMLHPNMISLRHNNVPTNPPETKAPHKIQKLTMPNSTQRKRM